MRNFGFQRHKQKVSRFWIPYYIKEQYNGQGKRGIVLLQNELNRAFSLTWPASMQIYWNKWNLLYKKRVQRPPDWFGTPTWPPFHCFGTPTWPPWRHVKTLYSDVACFTAHEANLSCNKSAYCRLWKVESSSTFCKRICTSCGFYRPRQKCFAGRKVTPMLSATPA